MATATAPSLGTFITKPGYWFITGTNAAGQGVAGVMRYGGTGRLPNATQAIFVNGLKSKSLNMKALQAAIQKTHSTFLHEVPVTGSHTSLQSIGARAVGQGHALYSSAQTGVQPANDLTAATQVIAAPFAASVIAPAGTAPGTTFQTVTARQIADAANATHVPNFIIAGVYKTGYVGDPLQLAKTLEYWYGAGGGGISWQRALASWHAGTPSGAINKTDLAYGSKVLKNAENLPRNLQGALNTGEALTIAAIIAGGYLAGGAGQVGGAVAEGGAAAGGGATAGGGAGATAAETAGAAGVGGGVGAAATKIASSVAGSTVGKILGGVAITALLTETGLWKGVAMVIAGAVLTFLALRQVAGATT